MVCNILKNIFLGLFGVAVIAMVLTVVSHFDSGFEKDSFSVIYTSITWSGYIVFKIHSEHYRLKKQSDKNLSQ